MNAKKLFILLTLTFLVSGALFAQVKAGSTAWIAAKSAALKSSTWFFAGTRGTLNLASEVTVLQVKGNSAEVRSAANSSMSGWTPLSNLSARRIVASGTTASATEIALAGKGFSQEVENAYKTEGALDYSKVDKAEAVTVSQDELYGFIVDGHLFTGEEE